MYPGTSTQTAPRSDERRRNPRLRASSVIYAQLGSDNGGIVVNLGMDGVACHAAQNFIAEKNSTLNLRLRGSGLNTILVGQLVWVGTTQKEVGISFKDLSSDVQKDISDWIAREAQPCDSARLPETPRPKAMSAMPDIAVTEQKSVPRSLSAALALAQATSADPALSAVEDANESFSKTTSDSAEDILVPSPPLALDSPAQTLDVPADVLDAHAQAGNSDSSVLPEPCEAEHASLLSSLLIDQPVSSIPAVDHPDQSPSDSAPPTILSEQSIATVGEEPAKASVQVSAVSEHSEPQEADPISQDRVTQPPSNLPVTNSIEKWIPAALLAAWKQLNQRQRTLLGHVGAGCIGGIIALFAVLAVTHIHASPVQQLGSENPQQHGALPPAPMEHADVPQSSLTQAPSAQPTVPTPPSPRAVAPARSHQAQPSLFASIEESIFGPKPETTPTINDEQLRVQVWISKGTGYYYCADDPYSKSVQPGEFMSQGVALVEGYRSRLGQFCD